nr:nuclear transport factor 2 family protein [Streptomyces sp. RK23]
MGRRASRDERPGHHRQHHPGHVHGQGGHHPPGHNVRIGIDGDTACLTALVEAQHVLVDASDTRALLKNPYTVDLVRDGSRWLIRRLRIDNTWLTGDPRAIFGA